MSFTASVGVGAAALDGWTRPILDLVARLWTRHATRVVHAIENADVVVYCISSTLRLGAGCANAVADLRARRESVSLRSAFTPSRSAGTAFAAHGCACMTARTTIEPIQSKIGAGSITGRTIIAKECNPSVLNCGIARLIKEARTEHGGKVGVFKTNRRDLMNLAPRHRDRECACLSSSHKWAIVNHLILAQEAAADDVAHAVWVRKQGREDERLTFRDFADVRLEAEEDGPALCSRSAARRHPIGRTRCKSLSGVRARTGSLRRETTRGFGRRRGMVSAGGNQEEQNHYIVVALHWPHHATSMTGAQPTV